MLLFLSIPTVPVWAVDARQEVRRKLSPWRPLHRLVQNIFIFAAFCRGPPTTGSSGREGRDSFYTTITVPNVYEHSVSVEDKQMTVEKMTPYRIGGREGNNRAPSARSTKSVEQKWGSVVYGAE